MKASGGQTLGFALILAGIIITYAGWKNVPVLSVIGLKGASATSTAASATTTGAATAMGA